MNNNLDIRKTGHGHWRITTTHYNKEISCITTDSCSIDDYYSDEYEKCGKTLRKLRGYKNLRSEIIRKNKLI